MSTHATAPAKTRTAPARKPAGFPLGWYRYRNYTLFAFTCVPIALAGVGLVEALHALGQGEAAWRAFLAKLAQPHNLALSTVCLLFALYFAFRFGWVGRKIGAGRIGPLPKPPLPLPLLGIVPLGGFVTLWLVVLLILAGVFP